MRLGQLARKLALRPDQIVEFLAKKNIQIIEGSNTRLEDDQVALVIEKFAPEGFDIIGLQDMPLPELTTEFPAALQEKAEPNILPLRPSLSEVSASDEKTEVIKAPKVELSGLKVLGKIDLPESKKKEQAPSAPLPDEKEKEIRPQERPRSLQNRNPKTNSRPAKNPIALQREREELEAQRKREAAKALEREKRAQHYFNKVKVVAPARAPKRDQAEEQVNEPAPKPKTVLGRFFRWFTT